jgi:hypothetical protein
MLARLRRGVSLAIIFSILLATMPAPAPASDITTVPAIDPLQVAAVAPGSITSATAVRPVNLGQVAPLPKSLLLAPHVTALAFKPFPLQDPTTGKPVSADATIYLPHEHRKVNAGKYYADVNRLEQSLNQMGYTLRSHAPPTTCKATYSHGKVSAPCTSAGEYARLAGSRQTELIQTLQYKAANPGHPVLQPNVLTQLSKLDALVSPAPASDAQTAASFAGHSPAVIEGAPTPKPPRNLAQDYPVVCAHCNAAVLPTPKPHKCTSRSWFPSSWYGSYWHWATFVPNGIKDKDDRLPPLCRLPHEAKVRGGLASVSSPWKTSLGSQSTAEFFLGTNLQMGGNLQQKGIAISASAEAGAYLLGNGPFNIASAKASSEGESGSLDLQVLGNTIWNPHGSHKFHSSKSFNQTFFQFQIPINILWFQITLEASSQGSFGIHYGMNLAKDSSGFFIEPYFNVSATFSANFGIGIVIVSVSIGIYGNLMIAQFGLQFSATGKTWVPAEYTGKVKKKSNIIGCKLYFQYQLGLDDNFTALSGQTGIQAQACVDLFFWSNCWTAQLPLFTWNGIHQSDNIFSVPASPSWKQIGPWYTDRPQYGYPLQHGMAYSHDNNSGAPAICDALGAK